MIKIDILEENENKLSHGDVGKVKISIKTMPDVSFKIIYDYYQMG